MAKKKRTVEFTEIDPAEKSNRRLAGAVDFGEIEVMSGDCSVGRGTVTRTPQGNVLPAGLSGRIVPGSPVRIESGMIIGVAASVDDDEGTVDIVTSGTVRMGVGNVAGSVCALDGSTNIPVGAVVQSSGIAIGVAISSPIVGTGIDFRPVNAAVDVRLLPMGERYAVPMPPSTNIRMTAYPVSPSTTASSMNDNFHSVPDTGDFHFEGDPNGDFTIEGSIPPPPEEAPRDSDFNIDYSNVRPEGERMYVQRGTPRSGTGIMDDFVRAWRLGQIPGQ